MARIMAITIIPNALTIEAAIEKSGERIPLFNCRASHPSMPPDTAPRTIDLTGGWTDTVTGTTWLRGSSPTRNFISAYRSSTFGFTNSQ
ncbi:hypothetical protein D3C81_1852290 [compost metagenome]